MIRKVVIEDAERLLALMKTIDTEAQYMLYESDERKLTVEQLRIMIEKFHEDGHSTIFICEKEEKFVGYMMCIGGAAKRSQHNVYVVIGILEDYHGQGIGRAFFQTVEKWASENKRTRLELTVITENEPAVHLYKKMGFEVEGLKRSSIKINGMYKDEYYMAKLLPFTETPFAL